MILGSTTTVLVAACDVACPLTAAQAIRLTVNDSSRVKIRLRVKVCDIDWKVGDY